MGTKSRDTMLALPSGPRAERAAAARKKADRLACEAWNKRMLGYRGPAQPSPTLGALNAGYLYLEVRCLGCDTHHQTVALDIVRLPKSAPIHELERHRHCSLVRPPNRYVNTGVSGASRCDCTGPNDAPTSSATN
jgi:hypothetical protein